ncbi:MAG: hypothetical protein MK033_03505 [Candidatus Caenarcaniphilales bacterium]|nr:hypothetical protein [Candidatus Caenarcaniphilales bacterium]
MSSLQKYQDLDILIEKANNKFKQKHYSEALKIYIEIFESNPQQSNSYLLAQIASCFSLVQDHQNALAFAGEALKINPNEANIHFIIGRSLYYQGSLSQALLFLESETNVTNIFTLLLPYYKSWIYYRTCSIDKALGEFELIRNHPELNYYMHLEYLLMMHHSKNYSDIEINQFAKSIYNKFLCDQNAKSEISEYKKKKLLTIKNNAVKKKIRIGLVSKYLNKNSSDACLVPIFTKLNKDKFEFYTYQLNGTKDQITEEYEKISNKFTWISNGDKLKIAKQIVDDEIDILIDSQGLIIHSSLEIFALKPAPIQISIFGYWGSTGLAEMDYICIDDPFMDNQSKDSYSEALVKLISYHGVKEKNTNSVSPLLSKVNNYIRFGSLNRLHKINADVIDAWIKILQRVNNSRLILSGEAFQDEKFKSTLIERFTEKNIAKERLEFLPKVSSKDYFDLYQHIDICLDTFPFNGSSTSLDALYAGVPVLTLKQNKYPSHFTSIFLNSIEESDLINNSVEEYINSAVNLSQDQQKLEYYRQTLRDKISKTEMLDLDLFINKFETELEKIYTKAH